jgi:very-short-patch-repair endonuclease
MEINPKYESIVEQSEAAAQPPKWGVCRFGSCNAPCTCFAIPIRSSWHPVFCFLPPLKKGGMGGFSPETPMLPYNPNLKPPARRLRKEMTDAEQFLWFRLRRKQILGVPFYRQKPLGNFVVDFYAPKAKLVVEVDGSQHADVDHATRDAERDEYLMAQGLRVLRFSNVQVIREIEAVTEAIYRTVEQNPPSPPFSKGG